MILSNTFAIVNGTNAAGQTPAVVSSPSSTLTSIPTSNGLSSNGTASALPQTTTGAISSTRVHKLTKAGAVGVGIGVVAICVALSVMGIFALVLSIMKKKGPPPAAADQHVGDEESLPRDSRDGTPMNTITDVHSPTGVSDTYFPKQHSSMMPAAKLSTSSLGKARSGSASSSNVSHYELGSPETLVPPPRRDRGMIDGMSLEYNHSSATSAAASLRNETMVNTEEPPSPIEPEDQTEQAIGRPVRSWLVGDDGFSVGLGHPGSPYAVPNQSLQQHRIMGSLSPQYTGDSTSTLTNPNRWSPTGPPAQSNLRFEVDGA
jgi:cell division protein FtsN